MGEVVWPHQLARSKGGKLGFKLIFEMCNIFLCSANPKLLRQIELNSIDIYTFSKSVTLTVGGHCECSPRTHTNLPTPLLSGIEMKGTYLVLLMLVNWQVAAPTDILDIKSTALNWDGTSLQVADVSSWMVAILLPTDVFHLLYGPWIHVSTMQESVYWKDWWQCWSPM